MTYIAALEDGEVIELEAESMHSAVLEANALSIPWIAVEKVEEPELA